MIDLDTLPPQDVVTIGNRKSPANLLRLAAVIVRSEGTWWLAEWLLDEATRREQMETAQLTTPAEGKKNVLSRKTATDDVPWWQRERARKGVAS